MSDEKQQYGYPNLPPSGNQYQDFQPSSAQNLNNPPPPPPPQNTHQRNYNVGVTNVAVIYGDMIIDVRNCQRCMSETRTIVR